MSIKNDVRFEFNNLRRMLGVRLDDPRITEMLSGAALEEIGERLYAEFREAGLSLLFELDESSALHARSSAEVTGGHLTVTAIHMYREGYDGYSGYPFDTIAGLRLNDSVAHVRSLLGKPATQGGGGRNPVLRRRDPHWLRYELGEIFFHVQLDSNNAVDLITIQLKPRSDSACPSD